MPRLLAQELPESALRLNELSLLERRDRAFEEFCCSGHLQGLAGFRDFATRVVISAPCGNVDENEGQDRVDSHLAGTTAQNPPQQQNSPAVSRRGSLFQTISVVRR
jgi:hypothetical protein